MRVFCKGALLTFPMYFLNYWSAVETDTHKFHVWMCVSVLSFVLKLLTSSPFMWLLALSGLVSFGLCKTRRRTMTVDDKLGPRTTFPDCQSVLQISGALYHSNVLWLQKLMFVPKWLSRIGRYILEPVFSSESIRVMHVKKTCVRPFYCV